MNRIAFFTMDVETFGDTNCVKDSGIPIDDAYDGKEGFENYLALLDKNGIKATLFLTGESALKWQTEIAVAKNDGHELAVHALIHESILDYDIDRFATSIVKMKDFMRKLFGVEACGYRAPCFGINDEKVSELKKIGLLYDSSALNYKMAAGSGSVSLGEYDEINNVVYKKDAFFEIKPCVAKTGIGEIPISGGAYMRLAPWWFIKSAIKRHIKEGKAYMFYVHPFELCTSDFSNTEELGFVNRMYVNRGRRKYLKRIEYIFSLLKKEGYRFSTISDYIKDINDKGENYGIR